MHLSIGLSHMTQMYFTHLSAYMIVLSEPEEARGETYCSLLLKSKSLQCAVVDFHFHVEIFVLKPLNNKHTKN